MKIAAVVVTYNRLGELKKNIESLLSQSYKLDMLYIIDNASTDETPQYLSSLKHNNISVVRLDKNMGGAGGFSEGMKIVFQNGYDWAWLMDDDGRPYNEKTLECLVDYAVTRSNYSLINCNVLCDGNELSFKIGTQYNTLSEQREHIKSKVIENCACVFNGSLIGKEVYLKIGNIKSEYFIRGDEVEYLMRCKNSDVYIASVIESLYFHPKTTYKTLSFFGKKFDYECMPIWKQFFLIRNYMATYYSTANHLQKKTIKRGIELIVLGIILHDKSIKRLFYACKAMLDGKNQKFDNKFRR